MEISNTFINEVESDVKKFNSYPKVKKSHTFENHVRHVIDNSLDIAKGLDVDLKMVYAIAAYHDVGLINGKPNHHLDSQVIFNNSRVARKYFNSDQIKIIKRAIGLHRKSIDVDNPDIYTQIIRDADRICPPDETIARMIFFREDTTVIDDEETLIKDMYKHFTERICKENDHRPFHTVRGAELYNQYKSTYESWLKDYHAFESYAKKVISQL